jgi:phosphoribosylformimino-5-aminoimidazole carboxamide ribotide isomerase
VKLVAVLDLMAGRVVHARRGQRDGYLPLESRLCAGSDPQEVAAALLRLHPFHALYIADLDAILGHGDNSLVIGRLHRGLPRTKLWVDAGIADAAALARFRAALPATAVIGSESLVDPQAVAPHEDVVLSLDFRGADFCGPARLLEAPGRWPRRVLAMNLERVGASAGPDLGLVARLHALHAAGEVYAAGGVRHRGDLEGLRAAGAAGALLASALHDGRLGAADLAAFDERGDPARAAPLRNGPETDAGPNPSSPPPPTPWARP